MCYLRLGVATGWAARQPAAIGRAAGETSSLAPDG
jgi:hypothetical protein